MVDTANQNDVVNVKNVSSRIINTSKDHILPGKTGTATVAELRQFGKFLKLVKSGTKVPDNGHKVDSKVTSKVK